MRVPPTSLLPWRSAFNGSIVVPLAALMLAFVIVACSPNGGVTGDTAVFCQTARDNRELLLNPPMTTPYEVDETIKFYDQMGQVAPLAIAEDWNQLVDAMRTANKLVPGNEESEQLVAKTAFASELAAYNVAQWLQANCGVDLPITTIVSHDPAASLAPDDTTPAIPSLAPTAGTANPSDSAPTAGNPSTPSVSVPTPTTAP